MGDFIDFNIGGEPTPETKPPGGLTIELVPVSSWGNNLRSVLDKKDWDKVRKLTYARAGRKCEVCWGVGPKWPVECHEVWEYDDQTHIQKLVRCIALCPTCHEVKHYGRTTSVYGTSGRDRCCRHLMKVNGWTNDQVQDHIDEEFRRHQERSRHIWELDLSWLETVGITPPEL